MTYFDESIVHGPRIGYWDEVAAIAKAQPDEWHTLEDEYASVANFIKTAKYKAFGPAGSYDAFSRNTYKNEKGVTRGVIFVKFVGPNKEN